jgi:hypothetical protein
MIVQQAPDSLHGENRGYDWRFHRSFQQQALLARFGKIPVAV